MQKHPVLEYMRSAKAGGMSTDAIVRALTEAGWHVHDLVGIALDHAHENAAPPSLKQEKDVIVVRNVSKTFGKKVKALEGVSLTVERGSVTALLGPNGAGKTTLVRILSTLLSQDNGQVTVAGFELPQGAQNVRSVIGLAGQYAAVDEILTGRENLEMVGRLYHLSGREAKGRAAELLKQFDLEDAADRTLKTYSGGMRRRLDLAASLITRPQILFLDEPTTGLDPRSRFALWHVIRDLAREGTTILLTTQYLEEADQLANKIFVLDHGRIIAQGTADELKRQVGGDVLELHVKGPEDLGRAALVLRRIGTGEPRIDQESNLLTMPVSGAAILIDVVRELDGAGIPIHDVVLRRPSLDDVFLKLTGRGAENGDQRAVNSER